jgi:hypothetical protein
MVQKHILISMIAPVTVAGILILAAISSTNQAFAQLKPTTLTIKETTTTTTKDCVYSPNTGMPCYLYVFEGKLTSQGLGLGGATITLEKWGATAVTGPDGTYSISTTRPAIGPNLTSYSGDSTHAASKSPTITVAIPGY